jgi:hypothetical protein
LLLVTERDTPINEAPTIHRAPKPNKLPKNIDAAGSKSEQAKNTRRRRRQRQHGIHRKERFEQHAIKVSSLLFTF